MVEKAHSNTGDYLKVFFGAFLFLVVTILVTSKAINIPANKAVSVLQYFILGLIIIAISFKGYYFDKENNDDDFPEKFFLFCAFIIPTALIFFVNGPYRELFFFFSFFLSVFLMLVHDITFKSTKTNFLLQFLTSVWILLTVVVVLKENNILPTYLISELSFLHLETIHTIKTLLLIGIGIHLSVTSFVEAKKPENKMLSPSPLGSVKVPSGIEGYPLALQPLLWLVHVMIVFLNILILMFNLVVTVLRIITDSVLRFAWQIILQFMSILYGWRSIILFLLLYLVTFSIPYFIKANSLLMLNYIKGDNQNLYTLLLQAMILLLAVFIFRLLVTFQFCADCEESGIAKAISFASQKVYVQNFIPIINCVVFYAFFITLTGLLLAGISNYWNSTLSIQGYSSLGTLTKGSCCTMIAALIIVIPVVIRKSKQQDKQPSTEKKHFVFVKLNWKEFRGQAWILIVFLILFLGSYFYVKGMPKNLFGNKEETNESSFEKIVQDSNKQVWDSLPVKSVRSTEPGRTSKESKNAINEKKNTDPGKSEAQELPQQVSHIKDTRPSITKSAVKEAENSIYIVNGANVTVNFQLRLKNSSYQSFSISPNAGGYFTFYEYNSRLAPQTTGFIKLCTNSKDRCVEYAINSSDSYTIGWNKSKSLWDIFIR